VKIKQKKIINSNYIKSNFFLKKIININLIFELVIIILIKIIKKISIKILIKKSNLNIKINNNKIFLIKKDFIYNII
jgi:hypothetical protein